MPGFEYGLKRSITEIVGGFITSAILYAFIRSGFLTTSAFLLLELVNILGIIVLIYVMPYWGTTYIIGWLVGLVLLFKAGLVNILNFLIFFIISLMILISRWVKIFR